MPIFQQPQLNTQGLVPDAAGAQQNALLTQRMGLQNQLLSGNVQTQQRDIELRPMRDEFEAIQYLTEISPMIHRENYDRSREWLIQRNGLNPDMLPPGEQIDAEAAQMGADPAEYFEFWKSRGLQTMSGRIKGLSAEAAYLKATRPEKPAKIMTWITPQGETINLPEGQMPPAGAKPYRTPVASVNVNTAGPDIKAETDLRKEFQSLPEVKEFVTIRTQMQRAQQAIQEARTGSGSMNAVDQSLITLLNKILDPTSVVRESEYARTPEGMSYLERMRGYLGRITKGGAGLSPSEREALYTMINKFYSVSEGMYTEQVDFYRGLAGKYNLEPENILRLGGKINPLKRTLTIQERGDQLQKQGYSKQEIIEILQNEYPEGR